MTNDLREPEYIVQLTLLCSRCQFKYDYLYLIPTKADECPSMACPKCSSNRGIFMIALEADIAEEFDDPVCES